MEKIKFERNWYLIILSILFFICGIIFIIVGEIFYGLLSLVLVLETLNERDVSSIKKYLNDERRRLLNGNK